MRKLTGYYLVFINLIFFNLLSAQELPVNTVSIETENIFSQEKILPIKLSYAIKDIKRKTNDSIYINSYLSYKLKDSIWRSIDVKLRARGNFRLNKCYFPPIKVKLKKKKVKGTLFEGNKTVKLVVPCLLESTNNDNVIKEYLAYKLFELVSPYYFKTRLVDIDFDEIKGKNLKNHKLKGFFVEDDKSVAKRLKGKVYNRSLHPLNQEDLFSVRSAFFQYMIGNTDFSQAYQHNIKLMYINNEMVPIPYDFDMSGYVNSSYATVSQINGKSVGGTSVTDRKYRGFKREPKIFQQVRQEFIYNKNKMLALIDANASLFDDPKEFAKSREFILSFFQVMENSNKFNSEILDEARDK